MVTIFRVVRGFRIELARFLLRKKAVLLADEVTALPWTRKTVQMVRELLFSLPVMMLEIAHHIDDESRYNQIIDLENIELFVIALFL